MRYPPVERKVLVTGCSTGIGWAAAEGLRARGWDVIPTARRAEDLERLRAAGFNPIELEMADESSVNAAAAETLRRFRGAIGAVVNNAGYGQPGAIEDLSREVMRRQFEVNVFGLQQLTNRFIPAFRDRRAGRIVNVSSVVGWLGLPLMGIYSASKFALRGMSDALRVELRGSGVAVSLVEPGPIRTRFGDNAAGAGESHLASAPGASVFEAAYRDQLRRYHIKEEQPSALSLPPEAVAKRIAHAVESARPRRRYPVTAVAWFGIGMARCLPVAAMDALLSSRAPHPTRASSSGSPS